MQSYRKHAANLIVFYHTQMCSILLLHFVDMMLNKDCQKSRFNPMTTHNADYTNMKTPFSEKIIVDELLSFATNKIDTQSLKTILTMTTHNAYDTKVKRLFSEKLIVDELFCIDINKIEILNADVIIQ